MQKRPKLTFIAKKTVTVSVPMTYTHRAPLQTSGEISNITHRNTCIELLQEKKIGCVGSNAKVYVTNTF